MATVFSVLRSGLWVVVITLAYSGPVAALCPKSPSTVNKSQSSDEQDLRELTEKYCLAMAAGDLDRMRQFWDAQSPNVAARLRAYATLFSRARLDFVQLSVTGVEIRGDKAVSRMTTDERHLDKLTGAILTDRDAYHGACRVLEWTKGTAGWKIEREVLAQDELASRLEAASSDLEREELLEKEKYLVTDSLVGILITRGQRHRQRGEYDAALRCQQLQLAVANRIGDQFGIATAWLEMGMTRRSQEDFERALSLEQKSLALFEAAGAKRAMPMVLDNLSAVYLSLGDYQQAFNCSQRSLRLYEEAGRSVGIASALSNLARIYGEQNEFTQALAYLEKAITIYGNLGDKVKIAITRNALADTYARLGHHDQARRMYEEILKQTEGSGDRIGAAIIRNAISDICADQGRYSEALDFARQALSESEALQEEPYILSSVLRVGQILVAEGKHADALAPAERAVSLSRQLGRPEFLQAALTSLGYCNLGLHRMTDARQCFGEAISILEKLRGRTVGGVEENQRFLEGRLRAYHGMIRLLASQNRPSEALTIAEQTKARMLLDELDNGRINIQKAMTRDERVREHRLRSELNVLNLQLNRPSQSDTANAAHRNDLKRQLEQKRLEYESFRTLLYSSHPDLKVHRGEAPIIKPDELTALVSNPASAVLEYVVTDDQSYLFAITRRRAGCDVHLFTLPVKRDELARQTETFRRQLAARDLGIRSTAQKLYDLLLKPAQEQLRGKTNLVIVPDGELWELPFQALMTPANRFVIQDTAIAYAPSLTVLREMRNERRRARAGDPTPTLLAIGNPTLARETIERAGLVSRDEKLGSLPEAEQEVKSVAQLYGAAHSKVYVGPEAREDRVKKESGQASILHFATHATLDNTSPMYSHLVLAEGDAKEDGLLEAWEIMQLDLRADLAILSACETARGRYSAGEGLIGLSWAMFVAGVPATVVSQWKVEAASTRDLLVRFHRYLQPMPGKRGMSKAEALREAELKLLRNPETFHPFYWAGFVLVGDGR
jgi:CHAT domain-containing protein/tetratricopeptide (TPR) repeat protein